MSQKPLCNCNQGRLPCTCAPQRLVAQRIAVLENAYIRAGEREHELRKQLAERDALCVELRKIATGEMTHNRNGECPDSIEGYATRDIDCPACRALVAADRLLASAEPSSQVERDERADFEQAFVVQEGLYFWAERNEYRSMNGRSIEYTDAADLNLRLSGWQARSALAVKQYGQDSVTGHSDVEVTLSSVTHYDHGPNVAEALARLACRVARFYKLEAPTLAAPAEQHQGKPVAWRVQRITPTGNHRLDRPLLTLATPEEWGPAWKAEPLYTHPAERPTPVAAALPAEHKGEPVHMVRTHGSHCWEEASGESLEIYKSMPEEYEVRTLYTRPAEQPVLASVQWPKLEKPALVGAGRFSIGLSARLVVEAAQRHYEYETTPENETLRIATGENFLALLAQLEQLRGLRPAVPPRPPEGSGLPRYGLRWNGPQQPLATPMDDGYWTPWHLANVLHKDAERYRWLRSRDLETISRGGVFAGITPENQVLNEETLDEAIDAARAQEVQP